MFVRLRCGRMIPKANDRRQNTKDGLAATLQREKFHFFHGAHGPYDNSVVKIFEEVRRFKQLVENVCWGVPLRHLTNDQETED